MSHLLELYNLLVADKWRVENPFSEDIQKVNRILFDPYATGTQKRAALSAWYQNNQPCLFGRIAAAQDRNHYCLIGDAEIQRLTDAEIADQIRRELTEWKRRSLNPSMSAPAHAFSLFVYSERLATAAPDNRLLQFARQVRALWGCAHTEEPQGTVHWETLFLQQPNSVAVTKFEVPIDFFASQGDMRWWHDHRVPGGILFTANSVGHMQKYREWYENRADQTEWVLKTAMLTIAAATETPYGRGTWLKDLGSNGCPFVTGLPAPFTEMANLKEALRGKDWTRYAGFFHTDHSIRSEFFDENPEPAPEVLEKEWLQDFTYIYDSDAHDFQRLIAGMGVDQNEIDNALGAMSTWQQMRRSKPRARKLIGDRGTSGVADKDRLRARTEAQTEIRRLLSELKQWRLSSEAINQLSDSA